MAGPIGQQLGDYRLTRLLWQSSFAEVYLGEHMHLGTTLAIKVLHAQIEPEDRAQFQQEVHTLADLLHPHIVRILDFGIEEQTPYLAMDYIPNGTLRARHPKGTMLPVATVVEYVKQMAQALQYAHERDIMHGDIKPENMLIGQQNSILLSDFSIALIAQNSRYQGAIDTMSRIAYMSPEQIVGHPCVASDQYALGIIAYEWLCGMCPFNGSFSEIANQHSVAPPPSPRERRPSLSPDIGYVILTALAKRPEDRFASVRAFANAFEQASQSALSIESAPSLSLSPSLPSSPVPSNTSVAATATMPHQPVEIFDMPTIPTHKSAEFVPLPVTEEPLSLPETPTPAVAIDRFRVSRRTVLVAVGVATTVAVGASVFVAWRALSPSQPIVDQPVTPSATPQSQSFVYQGHSDGVLSAAWSPDRKRIASGSGDKTVQVWNASDGGNVVTYRGHSDGVLSVAWSPDGQRIASSSYDKTVQVWNASDGSNITTYRGHSDNVWSVAWSPDGQRIASSSYDKTVQVWGASDGSNVFTYRGHSDTVSVAVWSPDGQRIASGSADKTVQVWRVNDGSNIVTYQGHTDAVSTVAWSSDGQRMASGSYDKTVQVWGASDGSKILTYRGHTYWVLSVAWSPDGRRIASGSYDKTVRVWGASDGGNVVTYQHNDAVNAVAWSSDGQRIASGSYDKTVRVWLVG